MKKLRIIFIIIYILTLMAGCGKYSEHKHEYNIQSSNKPLISGTIQHPDIDASDENDIIEFTSTSFFFSHDEKIYGYSYTEDRLEWFELIQSMFNIKLVVHDAYDIRENLGNYLNDYSRYKFLTQSIESKEISGVFCITNYYIVEDMVNDSLILPLDDLLADNPGWLELPDEWKHAFTINGRTYALPGSFEIVAAARIIRADWLEVTERNIPNTIDEFYEVMKVFTYDDPDKDSKNNTTGTVHSGISGLEDIFASFDARLNYDGIFIPTWNPNTGYWEDSIQKDGFRECIEFLTKCHDDKILANEKIISNENDFLRGYSGSYYSVYPRYRTAEKSIMAARPETESVRMRIIPGLIHGINKNINGYFTMYRRPLVLTKGTKYPKSTINNFLNTFLLDKEGFLMGAFGLPDISFTAEGENVFYMVTPENGVNYAYRYPGIFMDNPQFEFGKYPDTSSGHSNSQLNENSVDLISIIKDDSRSYNIPWNVIMPSNDITTMSSLYDFGIHANNIVSRMIEGFVSYEEGMNEYHNLLSIYKVEEFIEEQNAILSKGVN